MPATITLSNGDKVNAAQSADEIYQAVLAAGVQRLHVVRTESSTMIVNVDHIVRIDDYDPNRSPLHTI